MKQPALGKRIAELRLAKGLTQGELAERCGLSLRTVQRIESSEVSPRSHTVRVIFKCLNYDIYGSFGKISLFVDRFHYKIKSWYGHFMIMLKVLLNLKKNTMKKMSFLSLIIIFVGSGFFLFKNNAQAQTIEGWIKRGSKPESYEIGLDSTVFKTGNRSAFLESTKKRIDGFGTLMQTCSAYDYLGKRVRMTSYIKSENVNDWAGMWMRVDSRITGKSLSFDNMQNRPIKGNTGWVKCIIVLDVPDESGTISFGVLLSGTGKVWFDDIKFEVVDKIKVKPTRWNNLNERPTNINFED